MKAAARPLLILLLLASHAFGAKLAVAVFDEKTGEPVEGLTAANFEVTDGNLRLSVESAERAQDVLDVMLIADASFLGEAIRPLVSPMVQKLPEGAQMALVTFDQAATLTQDFTSSKDQLLGSVSRITYGNNPRVLDALYAAIDGGFEGSPGRRIAVVLSAGVEGNSRVRLPEVVSLAERRNVSIFTAYADGLDSGLFEKLAERTGGAYFHLKKLGLNPADSAELIYSTINVGYTLDVSGVDRFGDNLKIEIVGLPKSKMKVVATARPVN